MRVQSQTRACARIHQPRVDSIRDTGACVRVAHRDVSFRSVEKDAGTVPDSLLRLTSLPIRVPTGQRTCIQSS
jgi:hypothetical protein